MAFCPECGKSAANEATKCIHCGFEFGAAAREKKGGARFKGTMMMMTPPVVTPATQATPAAAPPAAAVAPVAAPAQQAAPQAAASPAAHKPMLKATMLGGVAAPIAPPQQSVPQQPPKAEPAPSYGSANNAGRDNDDSDDNDAALGDPKRYLPGDPMAPSSSTTGRQQAQRPMAFDTGSSGNNKTYIWVGIIALIVIAALGAGVAKLMFR